METVIILFKGSPFLESRIKEENTSCHSSHCVIAQISQVS